MVTARFHINPQPVNDSNPFRFNDLRIKEIEGNASIRVSGAFVFNEDFGQKPEIILDADTHQYEVALQKTPRFRAKFKQHSNASHAKMVPIVIPEGNHELVMKVRANAEEAFKPVAVFEDKKFEQAPKNLKDLHQRTFDSDNETIVKMARKWRRQLRNMVSKNALYTEYLELEITFLTIFQARPSRVIGLTSKLKTIRKHCGELDKFEAFDKRLTEITGGVRAKGHGYAAGLKHVDDDRYWSYIQELSERLAVYGLPVFINSGTLLGYVRDGGPIKHDDDIDLAILLNASSMKEAAQEFAKLYEKLREDGILDKKIGTRVAYRAILKLESFGDYEVDLFPAWVENKKVFVWPHTSGNLDVDDVLPLQETKTKGVMMPRHPEKMLKNNYGEHWEIPNKLWKFNWKWAYRKFAPLIHEIQTVFPNPYKKKN